MNATTHKPFRLLALLLVLLLAPAANAQFTFVTNNGTLTVTGYTGPGGNVIIPSMTNGLLVVGVANSAFLASHAMLFNFTLLPLQELELWGSSDEQFLNWFRLTEGQYWIQAGQHALFEYSASGAELSAQ
jgi:hypothetical protein